MAKARKTAASASRGSVPEARPARVQIQRIWPELDCGRFPPKRTVGSRFDLWADVFADGHDVLRAAVRYRPPDAKRWLEQPLEPIGNDRWHGGFEVDQLGRYEYTIVAWVDRLASWRSELGRKVDAGQTDLGSELSEGAALLGLRSLTVEQALAVDLETAADREGETALAAPRELIVDRVRARFGSWYELFPRSWGGFAGVERALPELARLGFDVVYLPPIAHGLPGSSDPATRALFLPLRCVRPMGWIGGR